MSSSGETGKLPRAQEAGRQASWAARGKGRSAPPLSLRSVFFPPPRLPLPGERPDRSTFWQDPDLGGRRLHFGHGQSVTCCGALIVTSPLWSPFLYPEDTHGYLRRSPPVTGPVVLLEL